MNQRWKLNKKHTLTQNFKCMVHIQYCISVFVRVNIVFPTLAAAVISANNICLPSVSPFLSFILFPSVLSQFICLLASPALLLSLFFFSFLTCRLSYVWNGWTFTDVLLLWIMGMLHCFFFFLPCYCVFTVHTHTVHMHIGCMNSNSYSLTHFTDWSLYTRNCNPYTVLCMEHKGKTHNPVINRGVPGCVSVVVAVCVYVHLFFTQQHNNTVAYCLLLERKTWAGQ